MIGGSRFLSLSLTPSSLFLLKRFVEVWEETRERQRELVAGYIVVLIKSKQESFAPITWKATNTRILLGQSGSMLFVIFGSITIS